MAQDRGFDEGKIEGKSERTWEIAKAMLKDGMSVEKVSQLTGLSEDEIKELENQDDM